MLRSVINNQNRTQLLIIMHHRSIQTISNAISYEIEHNPTCQKFYMKTKNGTATVEYNRCQDILDLTESFVPESLRGKGLGHILAKGTFDEIERENLKIKLTCTFLRKFYEENKNRYKHLVVD